MIKQEKIRQMVQNELYLQTQYKKDKFAIHYFKADYVALQRLKAIILFVVLYIIYILFYVVKLFYVDNGDMLHFDYQGFVIEKVIWMFVLGLIVGGLATFIASRRYEEAAERIIEHEDAVQEIVEM